MNSISDSTLEIFRSFSNPQNTSCRLRLTPDITFVTIELFVKTRSSIFVETFDFKGCKILIPKFQSRTQ